VPLCFDTDTVSVDNYNTPPPSDERMFDDFRPAGSRRLRPGQQRRRTAFTTEFGVNPRSPDFGKIRYSVGRSAGEWPNGKAPDSGIRGLKVRILPRQPNSAQVQAENGWHGWVDSQQLAAMPWMNPTSMSPAGTRRGKVLLVLGVVALIVVLVGAGLLAVGASQVSSVPVDGNWSGIETGHTAQKLLVEFTVTGRQAGQVTIAFWDPSDAFFEWTCADSTIVNGKFTAEQCLSNFGGDVLTVDVSGTFASSQEIDGQYSVTVNGTPYSGDWWGSPN
jgi:hypothetical protein